MTKKINPILKYKILRSLKKASPKSAQVPLAYVIGGLGVYVLGRFAYRYYKNHPEISRFIKDSFEELGERVRELTSGAEEEEIPKH